MGSSFRAFFHKTESLAKSYPTQGTNGKEFSLIAAAKDSAIMFCRVQRHRLTPSDVWLPSAVLADMIHNWITIPASLKYKVKILL